MTDPRLASVQLLTLAALRAKKRQATAADRYGVVWLDNPYQDLTEVDESPSGVYLPRKYETAEAWANSPLVRAMRAKLHPPGDGPW